MSLYSFLQKIKYRFVAKNRHGVHSPFVYDFVEKIINGKMNEKDGLGKLIDGLPYLNQKQKKIVARITAYYSIAKIVFEAEEEVVINNEGEAKLYIFKHENDLLKADSNDIIMLLNIYQNRAAKLSWQNISKSPVIPLSLDVFESGILFFRDEFKVKQHFILR